MARSCGVVASLMFDFFPVRHSGKQIKTRWFCESNLEGSVAGRNSAALMVTSQFGFVGNGSVAS